MASNQTNRFQSLVDSSIEEFIDGHESENAKKKAKHNVAEQGMRTRNTRLIPNFELP